MSDLQVEHWTSHHAAVARACIGAALYGPFLLDQDKPGALDWEFSALTGYDWHDAKRIAAAWDGESEPSAELARLLHALANNLDGYPHGKQTQLESTWALSADRLHALIATLRNVTSSP